MFNRIRFILVILMGIMCLAGCSADKEDEPPCPYDFSDWIGGASNLETEILKQTNETLGKAKEKINEWTRDPTGLEICVKERCRKDAKCIEKELSRANSAWFWSIMLDFFAIQPLDLIIMIILIILIFKKWSIPYPPERRYHNAVLWTFLTFFVPLLLIAIFIRGDSIWATIFWWLSLIILTFLLIRQKRKKHTSEEYEYEEDDENVGTQDLASELCPFCNGPLRSEDAIGCGPYCEQGFGLLPGYEDPNTKEKVDKGGLTAKKKNPASKYR